MGDISQEAPSLIGIGTQSMVDSAKALGLTWTLRDATVSSPGTVTNALIIYDGDTVPITCINLTGNELELGQRVSGLQVPPSGNFIIGVKDPTFPASGINSVGFNGTAVGNDSTASVTFVNMVGPSSVAFNKLLTSTTVRISLHVDFVPSLASTSAEFGINLNGTDYRIAPYRGNVPGANIRLHTSGVLYVTGVPKGNYAILTRWRNSGGGGTVQRFINDDGISLEATEVA